MTETKTISHSRYVSLTQLVEIAEKELSSLLSMAEGLTDLHVIIERTDETAWESARRERADDHAEGNCTMKTEQTAPSTTAGRNVPIYHASIMGRKPDGRVVEIPYGETLLPFIRQDEAQSYLDSLIVQTRNMLVTAQRDLNAMKEKIERGEWVISPTEQEEREFFLREERARRNRASMKELKASQKVLAYYERNRESYRANGHDIERMMAEVRAKIEEIKHELGG